MKQITDCNFPIVYLEMSVDGINFKTIKKMEGAELSVRFANSNLNDSITYVMDLLAFNLLASNVNLRIRIQFENYNCCFHENIPSEVVIGSFEPEKKRFQLLTQKQKVMLELFYQRKKRIQIMEAMNITENTFKTHRKEIYRKMEFKAFQDMILWCERYFLMCS